MVRLVSKSSFRLILLFPEGPLSLILSSIVPERARCALLLPKPPAIGQGSETVVVVAGVKSRAKSPTAPLLLLLLLLS